MKNTTQQIKKSLEEFDKKRNDLHTTQDFTKSKDGIIYDFGYKTLRGNEIFTIVDFGNIKTYLLQSQKSLLETLVEDLEEKKKIKHDLACDWQITENLEDCDCGTGRHDQLLSDLQAEIKKVIETL